MCANVVIRFSLLIAVGCHSGSETATSTSDVATVAAPVPTSEQTVATPGDDEAEPAAQAQPAAQQAEAFLGAPVFRSEEGLELVGSLTQLIGPKGVEEAIILPEKGPCGGQKLANKSRSVLALPSDHTVNPSAQAPSNSATVVEAAQWRMNEILSAVEPPTDSLDTTATQSSDNVTLGSVSKTRRTGAPPVYIVTGVRNCTAAVAVLDRDLRTVLDQTMYDGICHPMAVLPPSNLDTHEGREVVLYNAQFVAVLSLIETPGSIEITPLKHWTCPAAEAAK